MLWLRQDGLVARNGPASCMERRTAEVQTAKAPHNVRNFFINIFEE